MKRILMAVAVLGAFAAAPASAQWYIGGGVGAARTTMGSVSLGPNQSVTSGSSNNNTSWKFLGGYQFTPNWGIEAAYTDLGRMSYTVQNGPASASGRANSSALTLAGTGTYWINDRFSLIGKLGVSTGRSKFDNTSVTNAGTTVTLSGNSRQSDLLAGVGVGYNFDKNWGVRVEYENFGKIGGLNASNGGSSSRVKAENWALSVKYSF